MAVAQLESAQDRLCEWLSSDPEHILEECGDLLSMNQYKQIEIQSCASEKTGLLLKTIIAKGEDTCQSFVDILRKNQARYPQLQQFFHPDEGSRTLTVFADGSSVVSAREIKGVRGKSLSMKTELVSGPGSGRCGDVAGHVPVANYTATGGSCILADKICNANIDGDIDLSVTVSSAPVVSSAPAAAGRADGTRPSSQEPAVRMLQDHKTELIDCLRADRDFILQRVHSGKIVTIDQYLRLKELPHSEKFVIELIDLLIDKGQESCSLFVQLLKKPETLETYPKLKVITKNWH